MTQHVVDNSNHAVVLSEHGAVLTYNRQAVVFRVYNKTKIKTVFLCSVTDTIPVVLYHQEVNIKRTEHLCQSYAVVRVSSINTYMEFTRAYGIYIYKF